VIIMGVYERNKDSHFSRMWRSSLFRDTKEHVSKNEIDRIYSIEYDTLFESPLIDQEIARKFGWKLEEIEKWLGADVDLGRNDTSFIRIKDLATYESNENFIAIVKEEPMKRVEAIEYYKTYLPDSSTYYCPLTNNPYQLEISEDGTGIQVSSPITEIIIEPRYLLFSFNAISHGLIKDGQKSWD